VPQDLEFFPVIFDARPWRDGCCGTAMWIVTDRAAIDAGKEVDPAAAGTARVVVYYADEAGQRVAHYFKRIS
jgi:hypothetical protein